MRLQSGFASLARTVRESVLARDVGGMWIAEAVVLAMAIVQASVVARALGPRDFGVASLIISSTTLVFTFLDPQSQEAVVKYLGAHHASGRPDQALAVPKVAYGSDVVVGLVGFSVVTAGATLISEHVLHSRGVTHLLLIYAAALTMAGPSATSRAILTTFRRFSTVAILQASSSIFRTALMILLVAADLGVSAVVYAAGISVVLESICAALLAHRAVSRTLGDSWWHGRRAVLGQEFKEIIRFMVYTDLTSLAAVFVKEADLVVLGYIRGPTEAGYYRVARLVTGPLASITIPLQRAVYPRLSAMAALGDHLGMRHVARVYTRSVGLPIAVAALCAAPFLPFIVPLIAGAQYRPSVGAAIVLLVGAAVILPAFWVRSVLLVWGKVRFLLGLSVAGALVTLFGYFILGDLMGGLGVALARAAVAGLAASVVSLLYVFKEQKREAFAADKT